MHAFHWCQSNPETNFGTPMKSNRGKRMEITKCVGVCLHTSSLGVVQTRVNVSYILYICLPVRHLFHLLAYFMFLTFYIFLAIEQLFHKDAHYESFRNSFNLCVVFCIHCNVDFPLMIAVFLFFKHHDSLCSNSHTLSR